MEAETFSRRELERYVQEMITRLMEFMPRRCVEVITNKDGCTKY